MNLVFQQLLIIFCYVFVGVFAGKVKLIHPNERKYLTGLCTSLFLPFTILSAASMEVGREEFINLGIALCVMFAVFCSSMGVSCLVLRKREKKMKAALTGLITFPNCTFLGLPLCMALFGQTAVLYNCAAMITFNVLFFAVQMPLFTGGGFSIKKIFTIPTITTLVLLIMLILKFHWPAPFQTVIGNIGGMITPLSLIIIGVMLSENDIMTIIKEKTVYLVVLFRNFIIPLFSVAVLYFLPLAADVKLCILVYLSCPCATLTTIYSIQTDSKPELCANAVILSTIAFAVSLPVLIAVGTRVF